MKSTRGIAAAAAAAMIAAGAVITPAIAHAEVTPLNGTFNVDSESGASATWVITSTCSSADSCVAQVKTPLWTTTAQSTGNAMWHMAVDIPDGVMCVKGTGMAQQALSGPSHQEYFWNGLTDNGTTTSGYVDTTWPPCGGNPGGAKHSSFTMTKVG